MVRLLAQGRDGGCKKAGRSSIAEPPILDDGHPSLLQCRERPLYPSYDDQVESRRRIVERRVGTLP